MSVKAISTIIVDPTYQKIEIIKDPVLHFEPTLIRHTALDHTARQDALISAAHSPRSFTFNHEESFILTIDSGNAPLHRLHILLFHPSQRERVTQLMNDWQSWSPNSSRGAHWYRPSILGQFTREFEYFLDSSGDVCEVSVCTDWTESGISALFKTQKSRFRSRRIPRCVRSPPLAPLAGSECTHSPSETCDAKDRVTEPGVGVDDTRTGTATTDVSAPEHNNADVDPFIEQHSSSSTDDSHGTSGGWMTEATILRRLAGLGKVRVGASGVRQLFGLYA